MQITTLIEWCDSTCNPVMGCDGCELWSAARKSCYAGIQHEAKTFRGLGPNRDLAGTTNKGFSPTFEKVMLKAGETADAAEWTPLTGIDRPNKPWLNGRPRFIFLSDMGDALSQRADTFHKEHLVVVGQRSTRKRGTIDLWGAPAQEQTSPGVPFTFLKEQVIDVVLSKNGSRHIWLWLTKRPQQMVSFWKWLQSTSNMKAWPQNLWVGTTVTLRNTLWRVPELLQVGGADTTRFVSAEPLLEPVDITPWLKPGQIKWVIAGGESTQYLKKLHGQNRPLPRPFDVDWAIDLRQQCSRFPQHSICFFVKQLGDAPCHAGRQLPTHRGWDHGRNPQQWPPAARPSLTREVPRIRETGPATQSRDNP